MLVSMKSSIVHHPHIKIKTASFAAIHTFLTSTYAPLRWHLIATQLSRLVSRDDAKTGLPVRSFARKTSHQVCHVVAGAERDTVQPGSECLMTFGG